MTFRRNAGLYLYSDIVMGKEAIVFIDGNNWYHNVKSIYEKPRVIDFRKLADFVAKKFDLNVLEIRYYNSIPDIGDGAENYYKHMVFLARLKKQGLVVNTHRLKVIKDHGKVLKVEKGVDVMIATDMINLCLIKERCDCCILVTGDSDFIPAMELIKDAKKEVITASVSRGYSRGLRGGDFRYFVLKKNDLNNCMVGGI